MTATSIDTGLSARVREAVVALRRAEFEVAVLTAELEESDLPLASGYRSGRRLVEDLAHVDTATAKRWIAHGKALAQRVAFSGEPLEPVWPATAAAHEDGALGSEHVRVVARAMDAVGRVPGLGPDVVADAEETLAQAATQLSPRATERVASRLLGHLDPDGVAPLDPPADDDEMHVSTSRRDGALTFSGRIHGAGDAELLREVFDALSAPAGPDDDRPIARRRADALIELAEQAAGERGVAADEPDPEPEEPARGPVRGRPMLLVTIDAERLRTGVGHGVLDSDRTISVGEARRLGCDAGVVPVVLGGASQPLDVGRMSYTVPDGMRRALIVRDRGCSFPGCDRRPRRCQAHHVRHWADGGPTKIDNLALLCRFHHQLLHHGDWEIRMREGRPWFVPPPWIDTTRTPIPGGAHPPG